ncbi:hypothetical protein KFK09_013459 [Dendrobium nobile]|uniref:Tf2-1-like SH3-like domain-containing protein n=1 Tax=Dendrobium nobile TaxID=94219 RepID=A0A8T3B7H2_DENNO|nr:hypothetical protein KFK09_013459 [Dendrobium nobile]
MLRSLVGEHIKDWDSILPTVEFAYNNYLNRTTGLSPEIVYVFKPRQSLDLIPMCYRYEISESASSFASHMHELHKEIARQIKKSNNDYKLYANLKRKFKTFEVGESMMVQIRLEWFPQGTIKKLHAKSTGPFKIIKKINDNAYVVDLPAEFNINPSNIKDLVAYEGPDFNPSNPLIQQPCVTLPCGSPNLSPLPNIPKSPMAKKVDTILSDEIISTRECG